MIIKVFSGNSGPARCAAEDGAGGDRRFIEDDGGDAGAERKIGGVTDGDAFDIGVRSGVTTVADCGSVGVANLGVFPAHILPAAKTRVITLVNAGSFAHTMPGVADVSSLDDINSGALQKAAAANPGLIAGVKLRVVGPAFQGMGEDIIVKAKAAATDLGLALMVNIGDFSA